MPVQRWTLDAPGGSHVVEAETGGWRKHLRWWVDGILVADRRTAEDKVELEPSDDVHADAGRVTLRFSTLGKPRRATWYADGEDVDAALGVGGLDLEPEPGSVAAAHEDRIRAHPRRYEAQKVAGGVAAVVVPILLGLLAVRIAVDIPWPDWDLPSIPFPDVPSIPLPSIPWPDWSLPDWSLPDWELPGWLSWLLDQAKYVWPVVLAFVLARGEVRRRRAQDEARAARRGAQRVEPPVDRDRTDADSPRRTEDDPPTAP